MKHGNNRDKRKNTLNIVYLIIWAFCVCPIMGIGQINGESRHRIDSLFHDWDWENYPGGVVGVINSDKISYLNAFGNANLEYEVPNNTETLFNIGSISKQFTAMGIVLLQQKGLLSLNDPVKKFLPDFPIFQKPITIGHLLHHTSGLRDFHDLLAMAGWRGDDYRTNEDILRFVQKQTDLNFEPGEKFMYSNTGYVVLAKVIEEVTKEDFKTWMQRNIFIPLQMTNTYVEDNYQRVVPNKATSYYHSHDRVFEAAQGYWAYTGAGNMYSTTENLLKWAINFYNPQKGWEMSFEMLQILGKLNNGESLTYANGIYVDEVFGKKRIQHAGVVGGYRTFLCVYPEAELGIVVLTNFSNAPFGEKADDIAGILFSESRQRIRPLVKTTKDSEEGNPQPLPLQLDKYVGTFYSSEIETEIKLYEDGDNLKCSHVRHGVFKIEIVGQDTLKGVWPYEELKPVFGPKGKVSGFYVSNGRAKNLWFKKINSSIK